MKQISILVLMIFIFTACANKNYPLETLNHQYLNEKIKKLSFQIQSLSKNIDKKEANDIAFEAVNYSKYLAKEYNVTTSALFHNFLININFKKRGLCYHYANDLLKYLSEKNYKSFRLEKVVAKPGEYFEHNSLIITRDDIEFRNSIVLDAWRDTGDLYFSKVKDDRSYTWQLK